jgi:hypothetical protein
MILPRERIVHRLSIACCVLYSCMATSFVAAQEIAWRYTIKPGDTLIHFSRAHLINPDDWVKLQALNQIKDPYRMPIGSILRVPLSLLKQSPAKAEVIHIAGQAEWLQSQGVYIPLTTGQTLGPGAQIRTLNSSQITLGFADGSRTTLGSNGLLVLDTLSLYSGGAMVDTKLRLQHGQTETLANPKRMKGNAMQIITPSAIAAVRGTQFRVDADKDSTTQATLHGQVALAAVDSEVLVSEGFGSQATLGQAPISPVPLLPAVNTSKMIATVSKLPAVFDWPIDQGAKAWHTKLSTTPDMQNLVAESTVTEPKLMINQLPEGRYYLSVRAIDQYGIAGLDATHGFNVELSPQTPAALYPQHGQLIRELMPTFRWQADTSATAYAVEVSMDKGFKQPIVQARVNQANMALQQALQAGKYHWRIAAIAPSNGTEKQSAWTTMSFNVKPLPDAPDISQMQVKVRQNRVFIAIPSPPAPYQYQFNLDNPKNNQMDVWVDVNTHTSYQFLLKEYGEQTLYVRLRETDGTTGSAAVYSFNASPP